MARRIIISGEDLDLFHDEKISFNLKVNTIADLSNRNSSNSNSILIPRTGKNQRLLGMTGTIGNNSNAPYSSQRCDYIIQGTYIVVQGYLQIIETLKDEYRIAIFDGIIDFAGLLGNKTISDLDFSPENHILDMATYEASLLNTSGYIYAMGDFNKTLNSVTDVEAIAPSVYVHTIWDRIFTEAGLTYTGDFFSLNTDWKELVLPATRGVELIESAATPVNIGTSSSDTINYNVDQGTYTVVNHQHEFTVDGYDANVILTSGDLEMVYTGTMNFNYDITHTLVDVTRVRWQLKLNGVVKTSIDLPTATVGTTTGSVTLEVTSGDIVSLHLISDTLTPTGPPPAGYFTHEFIVQSDLQLDTVSGGTLINMVDYMSTELTQKNFVKDILQRYGLIMIRERENTNEYKFISMEDLLEDRTNNRDWTTKLTRVTRESYASGYSQNNLADYTYASGVVPYLTGNLAVNNANLPYERTIITAPYEVPETSLKKISGINLYKIPIWEYNEDTLGYDNVETNPRIFRLLFDATDVSVRLFGSANNTITDDVPFLSLTNMDYQYFFNGYYANLNTLLDFYKAIDVDLDLDIVDFKQVDFGKLIYLRQTGRYYYIDTVKIKEAGATARLIEIRNFTA